MLYKGIGALLLVATSLVIASLLVLSEKKHIRQIAAFVTLIRFIGARIEAFDAPLPDILPDVEAAVLRDCGVRSGVQVTELKEIPGACEMLLDEKEKRLVGLFFRDLGRQYRDDQIRSCAYYAGELEACYAARNAAYPQKRTMIYTLCVCAALAVVLLAL